MRRALLCQAAFLATVVTPVCALATALPVTQYFCFDSTKTSSLQTAFTGTCTADSPFAAGVNAGDYAGAGGYFHLETLEDALFNSPGVTRSTGSITNPGTITDSVDADDGNIDGSGLQGHSLF